MRQILWTRLLHQVLRPKRFAIFEACLIGLVAALAAVVLKQGVGWIGGWRVHATHLLPAWLILPGVGLCGGLLSGWLVEQVAPEASGSGIPQVKAVLANVPMALDLRVAIVKLVSGIIALGSGLTLGREGPTVQVGAALANQLSRWIPTSPDYRRQIIAAGAGAGLAAAFNTPIAGVLFVVEELIQDVSGLTLGTAILASFIGAVVSRWLGGHSLNLELTALQTNFSPQEIPFYLVMGVLAGILGAVFNKGIVASITFNRRLLHLRLPASVGLAGLISGIIIAFLPTPFQDHAGLRDVLTNGELSWQITLIALLAQFILTILAYASGAPGGLFAPVLLLGSALGYLIGIWEHNWLGISAPTTYALAGMGAVFSGVARVPITGIIIVFEMTTDFNLVLPLMIGSVVAYLVAEKIASGSLYDRLLELNGIHLNNSPEEDKSWSKLTAADTMQRRVETITSNMSLSEAIQAFSHSSHRSFPVVKSGKLVGIVTQTDLANSQSRQLGEDTPIGEIMTPEPVTVRPFDTLAHVLHLLNRYNLRCLPVTEGSKLLGIITRSDIIRVEADHLNGKTTQTGPKPEPSYVVYQTRAPATGRGRLLVPLSNPQTATTLLELAGALAHANHYELECLQVIVLPRNLPVTETPVSTTASEQLLRLAVEFGQPRQIPVHTQIRVAHDVAGAILEAIAEQHVDIVLMGWKGTSATPGRIFSRVVDTVIRQAACNVVLAKLNDKRNFDRWLVPMAGGPNAEEAKELLPALVSLSKTPSVKLCQVFKPSALEPDTTMLEKSAKFLGVKIKGDVSYTSICSNSVTEAVIECAQKYNSDVILLGASRDRLLQQVVKGNIPEMISRNTNCTIILVRSAFEEVKSNE